MELSVQERFPYGFEFALALLEFPHQALQKEARRGFGGASLFDSWNAAANCQSGS